MQTLPRIVWLITFCFSLLIHQGCVSTLNKSGVPQESDIVGGLNLVSNKQYAQAIPALESGLKWLTTDPSYRSSTDTLVSMEAEYISKLIDQLRGADQKGVFRSSNPMAQVIVTAIEAQAKIIKTIDERRRSQTASAFSQLDTQTTIPQLVGKPKESENKAFPPAIGTSSTATALAADKAVVGIKECKVFVTEELDKEVASLEAGSLVSVIGEKEGKAQVTTKDGKSGWTRQCNLCSSTEYTRRKKEQEIPLRVMCIGAEKDGRTFLYGGTMPIRNGSFALEAGQAFWMDSSAKGQKFTVASHTILGDPNILFLYKKDGSLAKLKIWQATETKQIL